MAVLIIAMRSSFIVGRLPIPYPARMTAREFDKTIWIAFRFREGDRKMKETEDSSFFWRRNGAVEWGRTFSQWMLKFTPNTASGSIFGELKASMSRLDYFVLRLPRNSLLPKNTTTSGIR